MALLYQVTHSAVCGHHRAPTAVGSAAEAHQRAAARRSAPAAVVRAFESQTPQLEAGAARRH